MGHTACASFGSQSGRYIVDARTAKGRIVVSSIVAAKASGARVQVNGKNTCGYYGGSEDLNWVDVL